jgi:putative ABC transport system substrate-binding protein
MQLIGLAVVLAFGLTFAPLALEAQSRAPRVGVLEPNGPRPTWVEAFHQGLRELGYVTGRDIVVEVRTGNTAPDTPRLLAELITLKVDVLVTWSTPAVLAARTATSTVPIVGISGDPLLTGMAASLARPGGNVTGLAIVTSELEIKNLELLKEAVPKVSRVGILRNPDNPVWAKLFEDLQRAAPTLGVTPLPLDARNADELEDAFTRATRQNAGALLVVNDGLFIGHRARLAERAVRSRLPIISGSRLILESGGLLSYGAHIPEMLRRAAMYVDKILKGAKPSDLPIEQPTKFELVINLKTAKALGLTIPQTLLLRADHVIE